MTNIHCVVHFLAKNGKSAFARVPEETNTSCLQRGGLPRLFAYR
jgi:hypothetical protein